MSTLLSINTPIPETVEPDPNAVSIRSLSLKTRNLISTFLNPPKVIPTENGLPRDWRGLAHLAGIQTEKIHVIACDTDPTARVLTIWQKQDNGECSIQKLRLYLEELDRFDVIDDTYELIENDMKEFSSEPQKNILNPAPAESDHKILTTDDVYRLNQGLDTQTYDAFVIFADEDIDFATELIEVMEKQYELKLCVKERDLVAGLAFEHKAIIELISERCNRLIVIISPAFLKSTASTFIVNYAIALGIDEGRRKIIPCVYEDCKLPQELNYYYSLKYTHYGKLCNFWERLRDSIQAPPVSPRQRKIGIQETVQPPIQPSNSESLPDLKPVASTQPKPTVKKGVKFGSMSTLQVTEPDNSRLSASTNALYTTPEPSGSQDTKKKSKNWFKKLMSNKDKEPKNKEERDTELKHKEDSLNKEKNKKFWRKKKKVMTPS